MYAVEKKIKFNLILIFLFLRISLFGQITYEHSYPYAHSPSADRVQLTDIGNDDFKYFYTDYLSNELKIFNIDHSIFANILVPVALINEQEYVVSFVTKSLFDCDTSKFEYAILPVNWRRTLYIYREDGTLLFSRDSTVATYCIGCFSGSHDIRPIVNTSSGAKLFLAKNDINGYQMQVDVYSLCGTLPLTQPDAISANIGSVLVYPNPNHRMLMNFKINNARQFYQGYIEIYDSNAKLIDTIVILNRETEYIFDCSNRASGMYTYRFISNNTVVEFGKFIIN